MWFCLTFLVKDEGNSQGKATKKENKYIFLDFFFLFDSGVEVLHGYGCSVIIFYFILFWP